MVSFPDLFRRHEWTVIRAPLFFGIPAYQLIVGRSWRNRLMMLKSPPGSTWGKDEVFGLPVLKYAALIWSRGCSRAHLGKFRPVKTPHSELLQNVSWWCSLSDVDTVRLVWLRSITHFYPSCSCSCSQLLETGTPPRNIKRRNKRVDEIQHFTDQTSDATNFREVLNAFHSGAIGTFTDSPLSKWGPWS